MPDRQQLDQNAEEIAAGVLQRWLADRGYTLPPPPPEALPASVLAEIEQRLSDLQHDVRRYVDGRSTPASAWRRALQIALQVVRIEAGRGQ